MLFQILIFNSRNKVRMVLKPRTRLNFRDLQWQPWPRTQVERLLAEMFPTSSAQLLAITTALSDNSRRILASSPLCQEGENNPDYSDIYLELVLAAFEIYAGGGGHAEYSNKGNYSQLVLGGSMKIKTEIMQMETPLIELAVNGKAGTTLSSLVTIMKWAFSYEMWDFFRLLSNAARELLAKQGSEMKETPIWFTVELMIAFDTARDVKKKFFASSITSDEKIKEAQEQKGEGEATKEPVVEVAKPVAPVKDAKLDRLLRLANIIEAIIKRLTPDQFDKDMLVDAALYLWKRTKTILIGTSISELKLDDILMVCRVLSYKFS